MTNQQEMNQIWTVVKIVKKMEYADQVEYINGIYQRWSDKGRVALVAKMVWGT